MEMHGETRGEQMTMMAIQSINQKIPDVELRDLFAMAAMNGLLQTQWGSEETEGCIARYAYKQADAMLEARSKK